MSFVRQAKQNIAMNQPGVQRSQHNQRKYIHIQQRKNYSHASTVCAEPLQAARNFRKIMNNNNKSGKIQMGNMENGFVLEFSVIFCVFRWNTIGSDDSFRDFPLRFYIFHRCILFFCCINPIHCINLKLIKYELDVIDGQIKLVMNWIRFLRMTKMERDCLKIKREKSTLNDD